MAVLFIFVSFLISLLLFFFKEKSLREGLVKSFLFLFLKFLIINELLSLIIGIKYTSLFITWILVIIVDFFLLLKYLPQHAPQSVVQVVWDRLKDWFSQRLNQMVFGFILFILVITLFIGLFSPPNNFDSMTYHMPRVSHWIQNESIHFYRTANSRQNLSMPLAEYAIMHFQLLSRSDRFANFVQWISFGSVIVLVSLISREMKLSRRTQLISAILAATLPMGILQSGTTQNDLVVTAFCMCFLYFMLLLVSQGSAENYLMAGLSMGLALLSKGTGYIFCAAIGVVTGIFVLINTEKAKRVATSFSLLGVVLIALFLNSGHLARITLNNSNEFLIENQQIAIDRLSFQNTGSNLVRNGAIHLATPYSKLNQYLENQVASILGSQLNNPESTFPESEFSIGFFINENRSVNLVHFILISVGFVISPWMIDRNKSRFILWLVLLAVVILFNLLLKWQLWSSRLQTPIFFIGVIVLGVFLERIVKKNWIISVFVLVLVTFSLPYLFLSTTRPVLPVFSKKSAIKTTKPVLYTKNRIDKYLQKHPDLEEILAPIRLNFLTDQSLFLTSRDQLYFMASKRHYDDYLGAVEAILELDIDDVGLVLFSNHWEYPLWVFSNTHAGRGDLQFRHMVNQQGEYKIDEEDPPSLIISTKDNDLPFLLDHYELIYDSERVRLFFYD